MGFWQNIKDEMWIKNCEKELRLLLGSNAPYFGTPAFMHQFAPLLIDCRDFTPDPLEAVMSVSRYLLTSCDKTLASIKDERFKEHLDIANMIATAVMRKWPSSQAAMDFLPLQELYFMSYYKEMPSAELTQPVRDAMARKL